MQESRAQPQLTFGAFFSPSDAGVAEAADDIGFEHVAEADDGLFNHAYLDRLKAEGTEFIPSDQDDEDIGALGSFVGAAAPRDTPGSRGSACPGRVLQSPSAMRKSANRERF